MPPPARLRAGLRRARAGRGCPHGPCHSTDSRCEEKTSENRACFSGTVENGPVPPRKGGDKRREARILCCGAPLGSPRPSEPPARSECARKDFFNEAVSPPQAGLCACGLALPRLQLSKGGFVPPRLVFSIAC